MLEKLFTAQSHVLHIGHAAKKYHNQLIGILISFYVLLQLEKGNSFDVEKAVT